MAKALLIMFFIFAYQSVKAIVDFFVWKNKINATGIVKQLKDKDIKYKDKKKRKISSIDYVYEIEVIDEEGKIYVVDYIEKVEGKKSGKFQDNDSFLLYFDVNKNEIREQEKLKKALWQMPLAMIVCAVLFFVCMVLAVELNNIKTKI